MQKNRENEEETTNNKQENTNATQQDENINNNVEEQEQTNSHTPEIVEDEEMRRLFDSNFLEYASYVIKERAIPHVYDGLKPVQRRILFSMFRMDDGRFNKVANVIGHTMQFHPHGDASIGSALIVLANKEFFIDRQGNFGNIFTGDPASAARYIECRLTPLARDVMFNSDITEFVDSYDGRNKEPVTLPAKVPSLLMLGADGIAVGMSTKILPHNFVELILAQIAILKNEPYRIYPDFAQGGIMDVSDYGDGDGRVLIRAAIEIHGDKKLIIKEVPPTTTTDSLINSIEDAAKRNKIKISSINDYTADSVEIEIILPRGVYAKDTLPQLYAYTDCEVSVYSKILVIYNNRPVQMTVGEVLQLNTKKLLADLKKELEILLTKLNEKFHEKTLAQIFIENRIYKLIEECNTYQLVITEVHKGLIPFKDMLKRDVTDEDVEKLLQIRIKRISRFDIDKNRQELDEIVAQIKETKYQLEHLTQFTINYLQTILNKYGKNYPRKTRLKQLEEIDAREVARENVKVGHDRKQQFIGSEVQNSNKNDEYLVCTEFDRLVLLRTDGTYKVIPIPDKIYVGAVKYLFKADKEQVYSMIYKEKKKEKIIYYAKRFRIDKYIMDKEYSTIPKNCSIVSLSTNYGVELKCELKENKRLKSLEVPVIFDQIPIRATSARGFKITNYPVENISVIKRGTSFAPQIEEIADSLNNQTTPKFEEIVDMITIEQAKIFLKELNKKKKNEKPTNPKTKKTTPTKLKTEPQKPTQDKPETEPQKPTQDKPENKQTNKKNILKEKSPFRLNRKLIDEDTPFFLE